MSTWLPYVPAVLLVGALLWVPGLVLQVLGRDRRPLFGLAAPAYSMAVLGIAGIVLDLAGVTFALLSVAALTVVAAVPAAGVGLLRRGVTPTDERTSSSTAPGNIPSPGGASHGRTAGVAAVFGFLVGTVLLTRRLLFVIQEPDRLSQRYDNIFHLNAIRYVLDTGSASSLTLGRMTDPEASIAVYPALWHALGALALPLTDGSVMVASNVVLLVVGAVVWPASCVFLTRTLLGPSPVALVTAGIASAGFAVLPFSIVDFGPLFPNLLGLSAAPVALAYLVALLGLDARVGAPLTSPASSERAFTALSALVVTGGVSIAHPNVLALLLVVLIPMALGVWGRATGRALTCRAVRPAAVLVLVLVAAVVTWWVLWDALATDFVRFPHTTPAAAYGEGILYATNGRIDIPWALVALTVVGAAAALHQCRLRWLLVAHLLVVSLYAVAASAAAHGAWRAWAVGVWYEDSFRLGAALPVTGVPLIAFGAAVLADAVLARIPRIASPSPRLARPRRLAAAGTVVVVVLTGVLLTQRGTMRDTLVAAQARFGWNHENGILTADEHALLRRLPELLAPGDLVLVNPWNGGSLAYAVSGTRVTQYHIADPDRQFAAVLAGVPDASPEEACQLAEAHSIDYVLDFGPQHLNLDNPRAVPYRPIDGLGATGTEPNLDLVASEGQAELWEVTAC